MRSYRFVHQAPVGRLLNPGFELLPTADRPHYTVRMVTSMTRTRPASSGSTLTTRAFPLTFSQGGWPSPGTPTLLQYARLLI